MHKTYQEGSKTQPAHPQLFHRMIEEHSPYTLNILRMQVNAIPKLFEEIPQLTEHITTPSEEPFVASDRGPTPHWEAITCIQHAIILKLARVSDYLIQTTPLNEEQQNTIKKIRAMVNPHLTMLKRAFK